MMRHYSNEALTLVLGLMAFGCSDHDRLVGKQLSEGSGGNTEPNTSGARGGDGGNGGAQDPEKGGNSSRATGGASSSATGGTSGVGASTQGGTSTGGTSSVPQGGSSGFGGATTTVDPCSVLACGNQSQCVVNASNTAECACTSGYVSKGGQCVSVSPITDVATGDSYACALRADGTVACWGQNLDYALGDGVLDSNTSRDLPLRVPNIEHAIAIGANEHGTCALESDHTVKCWGFVAGKTIKTPTIVAGISNATAIAVSGATACAVVESGHAYCWGVVGGVWKETPVQVSATVGPNVRSIYSEGGIICALLTDSSMHCIPDSEESISGEPILENVARFGTDSGFESAPLVVMADGTVSVPSNSKTYPYSYGIEAGFADIVEIARGSGFLCGVYSSGDVACRGFNSEGELCDGTTVKHADLAPALGLTNTKKLSLGYFQGCALNGSGELRCWGRAVNGELGDGTRPGRLIPYEVQGISNTTSVCVGGDSTCALDDASVLRCWGRNHATGTPVQWLSEVAQCSGGDNFCTLMKDGTVKCWGNYPVGDGTSAIRKTPTTVLGISDAVYVATGGAQSCAVRRNGTAYCWGENANGQLGDGTTTKRLSPVAVVGLSNAVAVEAGTTHSCALLSDGTVRCWGQNDSGQLGNGTTQAQGLVAPLGLTAIKQLSIVGLTTHALKATGEVFKWGGVLSVTYPPNENENPVYTYDHTPHLWDGPAGVAELTQSMDVRLLNGQIMYKNVNGWTVVRGYSDTKNLEANGHECAVLTNGKVRCRGGGNFGQLGDGYTTGRPWAEMIAAW